MAKPQARQPLAADQGEVGARIPIIEPTYIEGDLEVPASARMAVLFAHGSGSSRRSPHDVAVARLLRDAGLGTLLLDLFTDREDQVDAVTAEYRFDIDLLGRRVVAAIDWLDERHDTAGLPLGLFGAGTGAAGVLVAAAERPERVSAVVSHGGRPDLAGDALQRVRAPVLLLVGGQDAQILDSNRQAAATLSAPYRIEVVPRATHLLAEPGTLEHVASAACDWFLYPLPDHDAAE